MFGAYFKDREKKYKARGETQENEGWLGADRLNAL
jgi:hypothetical protein